MSGFIEVVHEYLNLFAYLAVYFLEALSLFCIVCSAIQSVIVAFNKDKNTKKPLLKGLSVALTFKLAAEIARTITVRSLDEIISWIPCLDQSLFIDSKCTWKHLGTKRIW